MKLICIRNEKTNDVQAVLLFEETLGVLIGFYQVSEKSLIQTPPGIWFFDLRPKHSLPRKPTTTSILLENVCPN